MTQQRANYVHLLTTRFVNGLKVAFRGSGGPDAATLADKCDDKYLDEVYEANCKKFGIDPNSSNRRKHPWARQGGARNPKR